MIYSCILFLLFHLVEHPDGLVVVRRPDGIKLYYDVLRLTRSDDIVTVFTNVIGEPEIRVFAKRQYAMPSETLEEVGPLWEMRIDNGGHVRHYYFLLR